MRRPLQGGYGNRTGDILRDVTTDQMAGIGLVALAYNDAESYIHNLVAFSFEMKNYGPTITRRINGIDGLIEIAKAGLHRLDASEHIVHLFGRSVGESGFKQLKSYRDAILHSRVWDGELGIGLTPRGRGRFDEVLISRKALQGVYERLDLNRKELVAFCNIAIRLRAVQTDVELSGILQRVGTAAGSRMMQEIASQTDGAISDKWKLQTSHYVQQIERLQDSRAALDPLPKFPEPTPHDPKFDPLAAAGIDPL